MVQGLKERWLSDAARQMLRVFALVTLADLLLRRISNGIRGLRVFEEHAWLAAWNAIAPPDSLLASTLFVAGALAAALVGAALVRNRANRPGQLAGALGIAAGAVAAAWRIHDPTPGGLHPAWALPGWIAAALAVPSNRRVLLVPLLGGLLATTWLVLAREGGDLKVLEQVAELALLLGPFLAWALLQAQFPRPGRGALLAAAVTTALVGGTAFWNGPAWRHLLQQGAELHTAGIATEFMAVLLALAAGALVLLGFGSRPGRSVALGLFLILIHARGPGAELVAARIGVACALPYLWDPRHPPLTAR